MQIAIIRHGVTRGNLLNQYIGSTDIPLAPQGEALARRLAANVPAVQFCYASPMTRTRQTADLMLPRVARTYVDGLRERDFGVYETLPEDEVQSDPLRKEWVDRGRIEAPPKGESRADVNRRSGEALRWIIGDADRNGYEDIAIVTHGNVIMSLMDVFAEDRRDYYDWMVDNCGGYLVEPLHDPLRLRVLSEERKGWGVR